MESKKLINRLYKKVKADLSEKRFIHTLGVVDAAKRLAQLNDVNEEKAVIAALFHDFAKGWSKETSHDYLLMNNIKTTEEFMESPELLHGIIAAHYACSSNLIEDREILCAIQYHTTGRKGMGSLEKVIYLADYIEENRSFHGVEELRISAYHNLDRGVLQALNHTIEHLVDKNRLIHPDTIEARNDLLRKLINKKEGSNESKK